jgi:hypothetical protein
MKAVLLAAAVGFGVLVVYRRQAVRKMDAAVDRADDALRKYEAVYRGLEERKGKAGDQMDRAKRELDAARELRDQLADRRDRLKRFF